MVTFSELNKEVKLLVSLLNNGMNKTTNIKNTYNSGIWSLEQMVAIFGVLRNARELLSELKSMFGELVDKISEKDIVEEFKKAGVTSVSNEYGTTYLTQQFSASIQDKEQAFTWLKKNKLGDLIQPAVNSMTLKAALKKFIDETGKEPDPDVIKLSRHTIAAFKSKGN